jgi:hypothetical protein
MWSYDHLIARWWWHRTTPVDHALAHDSTKAYSARAAERCGVAQRAPARVIPPASSFVDFPRICADPPGFDRATFHKDFNAAIFSFLRRHLPGVDKP